MTIRRKLAAVAVSLPLFALMLVQAPEGRQLLGSVGRLFAAIF